MGQEKTINGVNVERLEGTVAAIKDKPAIAKFRFRATNKWITGGHNQTYIQGFYGACQEDATRSKPFVLDADEPPILLGEDHGANPVEYVLTALAGCLTTSLVYHAAANGIRIDEVESSLEGDLDLHGFLGLSGQIRNGYENVRVTMKVKSDAPAEKLAEFTRRSPVLDIVSNPVPVTVRVEKK
ncbi:MAG TPA: OsmC family protein [Candidatus Acidoferrales bacterium]|nr:OsmC family protein [Candidatus Acidoferrales bacterium]